MTSYPTGISIISTRVRLSERFENPLHHCEKQKNVSNTKTIEFTVVRKAWLTQEHCYFRLRKLPFSLSRLPAALPTGAHASLSSSQQSYGRLDVKVKHAICRSGKMDVQTNTPSERTAPQESRLMHLCRDIHYHEY